MSEHLRARWRRLASASDAAVYEAEDDAWLNSADDPVSLDEIAQYATRRVGRPVGVHLVEPGDLAYGEIDAAAGWVYGEPMILVVKGNQPTTLLMVHETAHLLAGRGKEGYEYHHDREWAQALWTLMDEMDPNSADQWDHHCQTTLGFGKVTNREHLASRTAGPSRQWLDQVTEFFKGSPTKGRKFYNADQVIREYGKQWPNISPTLLPGMTRGPMGNCFQNAFDAVMAHPGLIYVEGYAFSKFFPMQHAWTVDGNGVVYDPTWPDGSDYFGVAFDKTWLTRYILDGGYYSVFGSDVPTKGLLEILAKGLPDEAMNTTGVRRTASLPTGLYWRTHPHSRTFGIEDATSKPLFDDFGVFPTDRGYSCYPEPWWVWEYCARMGWLGDGLVLDDDVIGFSGEQVGTGHDHEPLAVPDMRTVHRMPWAQFERELTSTPLPPKTEWGKGWPWFTKVIAVEGLHNSPHLKDNVVVQHLMRTVTGWQDEQVVDPRGGYA